MSMNLAIELLDLHYQAIMRPLSFPRWGDWSFWTYQGAKQACIRRREAERQASLVILKGFFAELGFSWDEIYAEVDRRYDEALLNAVGVGSGTKQNLHLLAQSSCARQDLHLRAQNP
jgi:hypothetical protein